MSSAQGVNAPGRHTGPRARVIDWRAFTGSRRVPQIKEQASVAPGCFLSLEVESPVVPAGISAVRWANLGALVGTLAAALFNFFGYRNFVFRARAVSLSRSHKN